jgi:acylglycerol lipase
MFVSRPISSAVPGAPKAMSRRLMLGLGLGALAGCASPMTPGVETPRADANAGFHGPLLERDALVTLDGERLPMNVWPAVNAQGRHIEPWAVVVALHGFDDYAAKSFIYAGPYWAQQGVTTYAYDQRGFGRNPNRGRWPGEEPMVEDLRTACALVRARHPHAIITVVGESMGGAVAVSAFASGQPPSADRLVLLSPAVWGWDDQPITNTVGLWVLAHLSPNVSVDPPSWLVKQTRCSDNTQILKAMDKDPNEINTTRAGPTYGLVNLMQHACDGMSRIAAPTLYLYGAHDRMIPKAAAFQAAAKLGPNGRTAYYPDGWHLLDRDIHCDRVLADVTSFIRKPKAPLPSEPGPIPRPDQNV